MYSIEKTKNLYGTHVNQFTAGSGGDNVEVTSETIDRTGYNAMSFGVGYIMALGTGQTLSGSIVIEHSDDEVTWPTLATWSGTLATETGKGLKEVEVLLRGAKKYIRGKTTLDLSASSTDTCAYYTTYTLGDPDVTPAV